MSHVEKKGSISKNHVFLKGFNFDPILWVILKKVQKDWILRVNHICEKGLSVRVCKKSSILRVIFLFTIINSLRQHFQRIIILWVKIFCIYSFTHAKNGVIFFDSCWKEGFTFYESYSSKKKFNSVSHVLKRFNSVSHVKKGQ